MPKFFVGADKVSQGEILITGGDAHHIFKVLRAKKGDILTVCDEDSMTDYQTRIEDVSKSEIRVTIMESLENVGEPTVKLHLFQGYPKSDKMDQIIQKAVELGVSEITPVLTARCIVKLSKDDALKKTERFQKIAEAAAKQSGRGIIPKVNPPVSLDDAALKMIGYKSRAVFYEEEKTAKLGDIIKEDTTEFAFLIGPEGGFEKKEIDKLTELFVPSLSLGKRILRTETVSATVLSIVLHVTHNL